ncbi:MAG: divalent-cation tolerance protein CutA [Bdellovibrionales bacterium]|nr:divalent-cation tolerance protein CutA [Bdellovibrionales bacterium]
MLEKDTQLCLVYTTHKNEKEAEVLAEKMLRKKLLVCANIFPAGKSVYMWNGGLNCDEEVFAIFKTTPEKLNSLEQEFLKEHPYETPCFVVLESKQVSQGYLDWALKQ